MISSIGLSFSEFSGDPWRVAGVRTPDLGVCGVRAFLLRELDLLFERVFGAINVFPERVCRRSSAEDSCAGATDEAVEEDEF